MSTTLSDQCRYELIDKQTKETLKRIRHMLPSEARLLNAQLEAQGSPNRWVTFDIVPKEDNNHD